MPHTKEGLNMLFPLHNSFSFQSNLMTGQFFLGFTFAANGIAKAGSYRVSTFILRGVIFADFADGTSSVKISSSRKKNTSNIKNSKHLLPLI